MPKKQKSSSTEEHAVSFFGPARHFQKAADLLPAADEELRDPINVLYFHAIELALKAFPRVHNLPIVGDAARKHHRLTDLYKECHELGLKISVDDQTNIGNIVSLFDDANRNQRLRYFSMKGSTLPEVSWTRDVVEGLMASVETHVNLRAEQDGVIARRAVKVDFVVSKPEEKRRK
jgi:hypothetical protein